MNNYTLNKPEDKKAKLNIFASLVRLTPLIRAEKHRIVWASIAILANSALNLLAPILMGLAIDRYIMNRQFHGVLVYSGILLGIYLLALIANYFQTMLMGTVGQNILFNLRNLLFNKIQTLPIAFFNQNKAGDLISRINNDTDKLNQFMSQGLVQFVANIITIFGAGLLIVIINWRLGLAALLPAFALLIITRSLSPWIKNTNTQSLNKTGSLSAEIAESLENFKIIVAFNRRDYFRNKFSFANQQNYLNALKAGIANNSLTPTYGLAANIALLIVVAYGVHLIALGQFTLGLMVSYIAYTNRLYDPLRQMAQIWSSFQTALAGWDRINNILTLESNLETLTNTDEPTSQGVRVEFRNVNFGYTVDANILHDINFQLCPGKTYALVGPTGGGKTTTASLIARLYDPTSGEVLLDGRDLRTYSHEERVKKIGFILQDPYLFSGTVGDNLIYGNDRFDSNETQKLVDVIKSAKLENLISHFDQGLETIITTNNNLSLGQKQIIAFVRAVLREPEILILDEATANIDTVTEGLLGEILDHLPKDTTKIIIAHRLNTIKNADEIFFVNNGKIKHAGSFENALELLLNDKRNS